MRARVPHPLGQFITAIDAGTLVPRNRCFVNHVDEAIAARRCSPTSLTASLTARLEMALPSTGTRIHLYIIAHPASCDLTYINRVRFGVNLGLELQATFAKAGHMMCGSLRIGQLRFRLRAKLPDGQ